ncbi:hypothetical protein [Limnoglobus roseus]|uniref:Flp family type IVb pilin n=1 Tax=Limnoglobus roseus TaxID=2598579 RepID=A0A5C1A801_9BACT|nr:hypothetical protein [Limnoglobus roseus]QEL13254.1 Flp family type IVb pilin [Limnoglobus roseus]
MTNLLKKLWADDDGAVISVELLLIVSILIFGLIPGFVALRNSVNAALTTTGNAVLALVPSFTFSGWVVGPTTGNSAQTVAQVSGFQRDTSANSYLTADQIAPTLLPVGLTISPAP